MAHEQAEAAHRQALIGVILEFGQLAFYSVMLARLVPTPTEPALGLEIRKEIQSISRFLRLCGRIIKTRTHYPTDAREAMDAVLGRALGLLSERNGALHAVTMTNAMTGEVRRISTLDAPAVNLPARFQTGTSTENLVDLAKRAKEINAELYMLTIQLVQAGAKRTMDCPHPSSGRRPYPEGRRCR